MFSATSLVSFKKERRPPSCEEIQLSANRLDLDRSVTGLFLPVIQNLIVVTTIKLPCAVSPALSALTWETSCLIAWLTSKYAALKAGFPMRDPTESSTVT